MRRGAVPPDLAVVELIGTPGAGKTVLSTQIIDLLEERGWKATTIVGAARAHAARTTAGRLITRCLTGRARRLGLWWLFYAMASLDAVAFVIDDPVLARTVLRTQLRRPLRLRRRLHVCFWFFQLAGRIRFLRRTARENEVLVVDDGFLHRAVHLFASHADHPTEEIVTQYVDLLAAPTLVVYVHCDEPTCEERVRRRGVWHHSRQLTVGELSRQLVESEKVVGIATRRARERGWEVGDVDNQDRPYVEAGADLAPVVDRTFPRVGASQPSDPGIA
jgi:hypothetical protein